MTRNEAHLSAIAAGRLLAAVVNGSREAYLRHGALPQYADDPLPADLRERMNAPDGPLSRSAFFAMMEA